jgi:hypothetical protein
MFKTSVLTAAVAALAFAGSASADLIAYWPLNDGLDGSTVTTAEELIDDASYGYDEGAASGTGDTWKINDIAHPIFDPVPGSKIIFNTTEGNRLNAGTQDIDLNDGFTWSLWVMANSSNSTDSGADSIIGTRGGWNKIDSTGGPSNWAGTGAINLNDDTWHHLAFVGDKPGGTADVRIYIDGVQVGSTDTSVADTFSGNFHIGGTPNWSEDLTGYMSEVAVWDERLSEARIQELAAGGAVVPEPGSLALLGLGGLLMLRRNSAQVARRRRS